MNSKIRLFNGFSRKGMCIFASSNLISVLGVILIILYLLSNCEGSNVFSLTLYIRLTLDSVTGEEGVGTQ